MPFGRPEVRFPFRLLDLCFHTLKLTFADRRQVLSVWSRSRLLIQENRYSIESGHLLAHFFGERNRLIHRTPSDRDKRNDIDRSHPRMLPGVFREVYQFHRLSDGFEQSVLQSFRFTDYRYDQSVMIFVITVIQQLYTGFGTKFIYYLFYFR